MSVREGATNLEGRLTSWWNVRLRLQGKLFAAVGHPALTRLRVEATETGMFVCASTGAFMRHGN